MRVLSFFLEKLNEKMSCDKAFINAFKLDGKI